MSQPHHFSQESLSLLLSGGDTGVEVNSHLIMSSAMNFDISPVDFINIDSKLSFATSSTNYTEELVIHEEKPVIGGNSIQLESDPGMYDFKLEFETKKTYPKNYPHCYSPDKNILIAKDNTAIPFNFTSKFDMRELSIKVVAVYSSPDNFNVPVRPCYNHGSNSLGVEQNFISSANTAAVTSYEDGRHCIYLPVRQCRDMSNEEGVKIVENLVFHCRSSCSTKPGERGLNNRAISLIFTLESSDNTVYGRFVVSLKVAVSPGRDIATLDRPSSMPRKRSRSEQSGGARKKANLIKGSGKYYVVVKGEREHTVLQRIATHIDRSLNVRSKTDKGWATYMSDVSASQTSAASQENGSQPENYSLEGWLARYGLEQYATKLETSGFGNTEQFQRLTERDLNELEILDKCHRLSLLHAAKRLISKSIQHMISDSATS